MYRTLQPFETNRGWCFEFAFDSLLKTQVLLV